MNKLRATVLGAMVWMIAQTLWAAPVSGLYQVREPLAGSGEAAREEAFGKAFETLVQRLTGNQTAARSGVLASWLSHPQDLALGYNYQDDELQVNFDPAAVMQVLREAQAPVWGTDRPVLLLWWVDRTLHGRQLLGDGQNRAMNLQQAALHRGLPVRFPLADLAEQMQADESDQLVAEERWQELLQRYAGDALVLVEVSDDADNMTGSWQLLGGNQPLSGTVSGDGLLETADQLFTALARELAAQYAVVPGQGDSLQVRVQGLDFDAMLAAEQALEVFQAKLLALQTDQAVWQVVALPEQLRSQLGMYQFRELVRDTFEPSAGDDMADEMVFSR